MLLTSPGDSSSSLSVNSLLPDTTSEAQSTIEGDRVSPIASTAKITDDAHGQFRQGDELASICTSPAVKTAGMPLSSCSPEPSLLGQSVHYQHARVKPSLQNIELDELYALRRAARLKTTLRSRRTVWNSSALAQLTEPRATDPVDQAQFAEPLSPLRERDLKALAEFFLRDDMHAIEADIKQRLLSLLPEPCWEDQVFDFLKEFL